MRECTYNNYETREIFDIDILKKIATKELIPSIFLSILTEDRIETESQFLGEFRSAGHAIDSQIGISSRS